MKLDTRQKILIPLIVVAFIYIGWQFYHIFFPPTPSKVTPYPMSVAQANSEQMTTIQPTAQIKQDQLAVPHSEEIVVPEQKTIEKFSPDVTTSQSALYLHLVKQYRELEAKRMLLEEKMAIVETQQKIDELNAKLAKFSDTEANASLGKEPSYKLIYLDRQNGQRSAILNDNNTFREVKVGTELSDGSKAIAINSRGVVLTKDGRTDLLTFSGPVPLSESKVKNIVVQRMEKRKISEPKSIAPKHIVKPVKRVSIQPKRNSKVQLTKNPMPIKQTAVEPNYTIKPVSLIADYSVKPVQNTSLQHPPIVTKSKNAAAVELAPKQTKPAPIANYSIRSVKSISSQKLPVITKNNNVTVIELAPKQIKPKSLVANYSVESVKLTSPQQRVKQQKSKNTTVVKHIPKQVESKPQIASYFVRPVKSIPLQEPSSVGNNNIAVVQHASKQTRLVKLNPFITTYSVRPVEEVLKQKQPVAAKNNNVMVSELVIPKKQLKLIRNKHAVVIKHAIRRTKPKLPVANYSVTTVKKNSGVTAVQLAPEKMKTVKSKMHTTKPVDLTYKEKITPPTQLKPSSSKTVKHVKITQLIPTKSNNKTAKVTKRSVKPSVHRKRKVTTHQADQPVVFSPLPAKNDIEQNENRPIILMN
ncbi:MAG: hypothetical protein AMJ43_00735 [Coxiella sp. DG_40]|nr:MAG: hypothetical protein AMJ43_00735 [Coxiella sp. DG_40]